MKRLLNFTLMVIGCTLWGVAGNFSHYVNPFIGTGAIQGGLSGNNYPGATAPFGMVQLSPDTHNAPDWFNASGYDYNDNTIYGFSHTRLSGTGACDLIDISLFPTTSDRRKSQFSHDNEKAAPGYYSVMLNDEGILAELTATPRVGIHRYVYPPTGSMRLWIDLDHSAQKGSWDRRIINAQIKKENRYAISGWRVITGWAKLRKVYFYAVFSAPIDSIMIEKDNNAISADLVNGSNLKALVSFANADRRDLTVKVGISAVSVANASDNLAAEAQDGTFEQYKALADASWDKELGKIEIGGTAEQKTTFYTALYHTMIQPNVFSDANGEYMAADYTTRRVAKGEAQYTTFSLWDTYRAAHPLYSIIETKRSADFVNSMIRHCQAYGYLPVWQLWGQDNYCMIGNHAIPVIVDAVLKGIDGIDSDQAYEAVKKSATTDHLNSPFSVWEKFGYMPENIQTQSVSISLELAFDDWCVAQLAKHMGKTDDYNRFLKRSQNYRNLYNHNTHFFQPKNDKGDWMSPFDPLKYGANGGYAFTEGNAWQYYWYVPQDIEDLIALTGGATAFEKKLDAFFTLTDTSGAKNDNISGLIGQYAHGNEPSHHVAYLYNYVGKPGKTQDMVYRIMTTLYNNTSSGYAGNDDCGEMSAWFVFSAMGFYPVNPASGEYAIGTPLFNNCTIHLENGKSFNIVANRKNPSHHHVKSVIVNGKRRLSPTVFHKEIMDGGTLELIMAK